MAQTLFGRPIDIPESWEDGSVYTYFLNSEDPAGTPAGSAPPTGGPVTLHAASTGTGKTFRANLVVTRQRWSAGDLDRYVQEDRATLQKKIPGAKLLSETRTELAGTDAREQDAQITLGPKLPTLCQWHAWLLRDGFGYHLCGTTSRERFGADKARFREVIGSWH